MSVARYTAHYTTPSPNTVTATGGVVVGGVATGTATYTVTMAGGLVMGGTDQGNFKKLRETFAGGGVLDSTAAATVQYTASATGGLVMGGTAGDLSTVKVSFASTVTLAAGSPATEPILRQTVTLTGSVQNALPIAPLAQKVLLRGSFAALGVLATGRYRR